LDLDLNKLLALQPVRLWFSSNPLYIFYPIPNFCKAGLLLKTRKLPPKTAQVATAEYGDIFHRTIPK